MASIPTLAQMMLQLPPDIQPSSDALLKANRIQGGNINNQTALLQLEDLRRQQQTAADVRQAYQRDPSLLGLGGGGGPQSLLGSPDLAMTQMTTRPADAVMGTPGTSATQTVGAPMDLSRFATGGAQPTLATLGAPPRQDPLEAMARQNPDAALQIMGQRFKLQEQQLGMRAKVADAVGQRFQGVTDQASYDEARGDLQSFAPQLAARLPQVYNKETVQRLQEQSLSVKEGLTLQIEEGKNQLAAAKLRLQAANIPNYTGDAQLDALIYTKMKDQPPGTMPSRAIVDAAYQQREADKLRVSKEQGLAAAETERTAKPLEGAASTAVSTLTTLRKMTDDMSALYKDDYTGPMVGRSGYLREQAGWMDEKETAFRATVKDVQDILARLRSGAALPPDEMRRLEGLAPDVNDRGPAFKSKLQRFQRALEQTRESLLEVGTTERGRLREEMRPTTPRVGQPAPSGGQPSTPLKPVGEMSTDELKAERDRLRKGGG